MHNNENSPLLFHYESACIKIEGMYVCMYVCNIGKHCMSMLNYKNTKEFTKNVHALQN